jgi:hypothetical protein
MAAASSSHVTYVESVTTLSVTRLYRVSQEERSVFWEVIVSVILKCIYACVLFRDRAISLYSSKIVDNKEILRTVSNTGIYCSSDKVGTVYLV